MVIIRFWPTQKGEEKSIDYSKSKEPLKEEDLVENRMESLISEIQIMDQTNTSNLMQEVQTGNSRSKKENIINKTQYIQTCVKFTNEYGNYGIGYPIFVNFFAPISDRNQANEDIDFDFKKYGS